MHRSDPKRAFLVQQQISELGPEDAHRVFQQRLKYRLQFTGRRSDDFENLSAREQLLQGLVPLPDESRDLFFRACRDRTATTHGLRCMAAPFDRCTAYFGAPFHTHTLGCGQAIVVRLAGTLEAGPGIPRSEYMRRRLMSESGQSRRMRSTPREHVCPLLPESGQIADRLGMSAQCHKRPCSEQQWTAGKCH